MLTSWMQASGLLGFEMKIASPAKLLPPEDVLKEMRALGADIELGQDAEVAVEGADCVVTDTWVSMVKQTKKCG